MNIVIIGGGIGGLTLAALLGRDGVRVCLVDQGTPPAMEDVQPNGRTTALFGGSIDIVKRAGIWERVLPYACIMRSLQIMDVSERGGEAVQSAFHADEIGVEAFGYNIPNDVTRAALFEAVQGLDSVDVICPAAFEGYAVEGQRVVVQTSEGEIEAKLIVGADGRRSRVREIAGIAVRERRYEQSAITLLVNHSKSHSETSTEFHRSGGPLAFVPLPGNQSSVVWVNKAARADELMVMRKQDFMAALQAESQDILGGLTMECSPHSWPLCSMNAKALSAPRMALVAEAAHVMSPITAQGLNLSLRDVEALADLVVKHIGLGLDVGSRVLLQDYESARKIDVAARSFGVDRMNKLVANDTKIVTSLRRAGLSTLDKFPFVKEVIMRRGLVK